MDQEILLVTEVRTDHEIYIVNGVRKDQEIKCFFFE